MATLFVSKTHRCGRVVVFSALIFVLFCLVCIRPGKSAEKQVVTFDINAFYIEGNTVLEKDVLTMQIKDFIGPGKTSSDVEAARDSLERFYHELGYPTVLVNIPEQTVSDGIVRFQVIESKIKRVWVEGNKYYTMAHIKKTSAFHNPW